MYCIVLYETNFTSGCDVFPSEYEYLSPSLFNNPTASQQRVETQFGTLYLPQCLTPQAKPLAASLIFISFTFFCGYFLINMSLAAVAIGFKEKLAELRNQGLYGDEDDNNKNQAKSQPQNTLASASNSKAAKLLGANKEKAYVKKMLHDIWADDRNHKGANEDALSLIKIKSFNNFI